MARLVAGEVFGWCLLVLVIVLAFAGLATAVESGSLGPADALLAGLRTAPALVLPVLPLCAAAGAVLAAVHLDSTGQQTALDGAGVGPLRTGLVVAMVGLALGLGGWALNHSAVPAWLVQAERARGLPEPAWVWVDDVAVRLRDGVAWRVADGELQRAHGILPDPAVLELAHERQRPRRATGAALAGAEGAPAQVERWSRLARVGSCAAWAMVGWFRWSRHRGVARVAAVMGLALAWAAADLVFQGLGGQLRMPPLAGALVLPGLVWWWLCALAWRRRG